MLPQGQCKPNAMKLASIAEVQPELANFNLQRYDFYLILKINIQFLTLIRPLLITSSLPHTTASSVISRYPPAART